MMTDETPTLSPSLRILKFLVLAMGVTMIFGFIFLLSMIYRTIGAEKQDSCVDATIEIPANTSVLSIAPAAKKDEISLLLQDNDGKQSILITNSCDGSILRTHQIKSPQQ